METVTVRQRRSTGEVVLPFDVFRRADHGQLCSMLGLRVVGPKVVGGEPEAPVRRRRRGKR